MELGRKCFISLLSGLVTLGLVVVALCIPALLVFESQPYARVILASGQLDTWSARKLNLNPEEFEMVRNNYKNYLEKIRELRNKNSEADDSSSSSSSEEEDMEEVNDEVVGIGKNHQKETAIKNQDSNQNDGNDNVEEVNEDNDKEGDEEDDKDGDDDGDDQVGDKNKHVTYSKMASDSSESSSDDDGDDDSSSDDSDELTLEQRLEDQPLRQLVELGLFSGRMCTVLQNFHQECSSIPISEGLLLMYHEVTVMTNDLSMITWNNMCVTVLFSMASCCIGLVCLVASLKPCCKTRTLPVNVAFIAFIGSGLLVFVPIVRLLLISSDLKTTLKNDFNITMHLKTSWSLVVFGAAAPFAFLASFSLVALRWFRETKQYMKVITKSDEDAHLTGTVTEVRMTKKRPHDTTDKPETNGNLYENIDEVGKKCNAPLNSGELLLVNGV